MRHEAQAVGSICDSCECFIDLTDELAICGGEIQVQTLFEALAPELRGIARGLGFS